MRVAVAVDFSGRLLSSVMAREEGRGEVVLLEGSEGKEAQSVDLPRRWEGEMGVGGGGPG